jgi:exonuclease SbcC
VIEAWLAEAERLAAVVSGADAAAGQAVAVLDAPARALAAAEALQQAEQAADAAELARSAADRAAERAERARHAAERFAACRVQFDHACAELRAVESRCAPVLYLAKLTRGMAGQRRMALTTYVLRHWFEQVLSAANLRLARMSSGRYELVRVDEGGAKTERSGLTLQVLDRHTGEQRSPRSLSGGETFYTSLSLALGLADVVTAQAGGIDLDTLFIDEGFGSLDEETLEQVMSVIDDLREGGRTVGIVSHVADLKDRIAERIEVRRLPDGSSTLRVVA